MVVGRGHMARLVRRADGASRFNALSAGLSQTPHPSESICPARTAWKPRRLDNHLSRILHIGAPANERPGPTRGELLELEHVVDDEGGPHQGLQGSSVAQWMVSGSSESWGLGAGEDSIENFRFERA